MLDVAWETRMEEVQPSLSGSVKDMARIPPTAPGRKLSVPPKRRAWRKYDQKRVAGFSF